MKLYTFGWLVNVGILNQTGSLKWQGRPILQVKVANVCSLDACKLELVGFTEGFYVVIYMWLDCPLNMELLTILEFPL